MSRLLSPARTVPGLTDVALLVSRVAVGVVLLAHGLQKAFEFTPAGTAAAFDQMGVPAAGLVAWFTLLAEIVGALDISVEMSGGIRDDASLTALAAFLAQLK